MKTKLRVLFIEDSADDVVLVARALERADYEVSCERVETEPGLKQALARENWDAVLCDYTMPEFGGKAALRVVRELAVDVPFIYVSGTIGVDAAVEAVKSGAQDYVLKNNLKRLPAVIGRELREAGLRRQQRLLENDRDQLVAELESALRESRKLSGRFAICGHCKRISVGDGTWQALEAYVQAHSEAHFSHGLCPECQSHLNNAANNPDWLGDET